MLGIPNGHGLYTTLGTFIKVYLNPTKGTMGLVIYQVIFLCQKEMLKKKYLFKIGRGGKGYRKGRENCCGKYSYIFFLPFSIFRTCFKLILVHVFEGLGRKMKKQYIP